MWPATRKEGGDIRVGSGGYTIVDTPANPNAQKLFTNWFLSREGQMLYQEATKNNSLRTDLPKDVIPEKDHLDATTDYLSFALDPDILEQANAAFVLVDAVRAAAGR